MKKKKPVMERHRLINERGDQKQRGQEETFLEPEVDEAGRMPGILYFPTSKSLKKYKGLCFLASLCFIFTACGSGAAGVETEIEQPSSSAESELANANFNRISGGAKESQDIQLDGAEITETVGVQKRTDATGRTEATETTRATDTTASTDKTEVGAEEFCGTEDGPACPLVKPIVFQEPIYERTQEQLSRMEEFDRLTLQDKGVALADGKVPCTLFIHDEAWEHKIAPEIITYVGQEAYEKWKETIVGCGSIYEFADGFGLEFSTMEEIIVENNLQNVYDLEKLRTELSG